MNALLLLVLGCRSEDGIKAYNSQPVVTIVSHVDGAELQDGYSVVLIGQVSDANHSNSELLVSWSTNNQDLCSNEVPSENGETSCTAIFSEDDTEIRLHAVDPEGSAGVNNIAISVVPTEPPNAQIISPIASGVYYTDQKITFEGTVSDEEDEPEALVASWESDLVGELVDVDSTPSSSGSVLGFGYLSQGEHAIKLRVEDSTGKDDTDSVIIRVGPPNSAPSCSILSPQAGSTGVVDSIVTFLASADDVDIPEDMLQASWISDKDGALGDSIVNSDGSITFPFSLLSVDTHVITLTVEDEVGATCTSSITYTVGTPPSVTIDSPSSAQVFSVGESISFQATVSDSQDLADGIDLDWQLNGVSFSSQGATSTGVAQFFDSSLIAGTYSLVVLATDSAGLTDSQQVSFTVNGLPSQPAIHIEPTTATTQDALYVQIDTPSVDPEGTNVQYSYQWLLEGTVQPTYTTSSVPASATNVGEQWSVQVTPNDGIADGAMAEASIIIQNSAPSITSISITPALSVFSDSVLTCSAAAFDPDETLSPSYEWRIDGVLVGSQSTLDLSAAGASPLDSVICTANVVDSSGAQASSSATVSVENRPPTVQSVTITPSNAYTNDTLIASDIFYDDDLGQVLTGTYDWHVIDAQTGSDTQVQSGSNPSLDGGAFFSRDDEVYVTVTPNDGIDDGTSLTSASITIANSIPESPGISITPDPAQANTDDLTCSIDTLSVDDDEDTVLYTYVWTDPNGTIQQTTTETSSTTDIFLASGTIEGTWTCLVTPYDSTDYGSAVSTTTTLVSGCPADGDGSEETCPANDCLQILTDGYSVGDGVYWLDPDGNGAFEAYCDMTTDGGGWTLLAKFVQTGAISQLPTTTYDTHFRYNAWIKGESVDAPTSPSPSYSGFTIESLDWRRLLQVSNTYELRQHFFKNSNQNEFDVAYDFSYNGYVSQNDGSSASDRAWTLSNRNVLTDNSGVSWNTPSETVRFWLPFTEGITGTGYTACGGYRFDTIYCTLDLPRRRWGNAGIIGASGDGQDPAASWAPHMNTMNSAYDIVYVHQQTNIYGITGSNMTLLYWLR